ncbi:hypothetical protein LTR74_013390 [Friedmanniomyces endolithicus]|nr:hypothetical protein LTR74_013390 [Friedmanniomyces endolithicus]
MVKPVAKGSGLVKNAAVENRSLGGLGSGLVAVSMVSSGVSSLTRGSSEHSLDVVAGSSCSIFLRFHKFPSGTASSGVRQYVTVLVTTCLTLTLPGLPLASVSTSRGE